MHLGDRSVGSVIDFKFTTLRDDTGAPITLAGTPKARVYKGTSTTESADITPTVDFDGRTGLHHVNIDTDDVFYVAGEDYDVVLTAGTVNAISKVGLVLAHFTLEKESALRANSSAAGSGGTAGGALARLGGSAQISVVAPIAASGLVTIVQGDDYLDVDGTALEFVNPDGTWPALTSGDVDLKIGNADAIAGVIDTATGPNQTVHFDLADTVTSALLIGRDRYFVRATLTGGSVVTLANGVFVVRSPQNV